MLRASVGLAVLLAMSAAATAKDDAQAVKQKKVCKTYKVTGSLTRVQRICRTEEEWRVSLENTKTGVDDLQRGASGAPKCISMADAACPP